MKAAATTNIARLAVLPWFANGKHFRPDKTQIESIRDVGNVHQQPRLAVVRTQPYLSDRSPRKTPHQLSVKQRMNRPSARKRPNHSKPGLLHLLHQFSLCVMPVVPILLAMLVKLAAKDTETVVDALIKNTRKLPQELYKSLTWDRGKEMAAHKRFTLATDIQVYFCDPRSPWQRGSNENTNGLLRQYMPKGIDISSYSQAKLNAVARQLNERPRKTLGFQTPAERFSQTVALTS